MGKGGTTVIATLPCGREGNSYPSRPRNDDVVLFPKTGRPDPGIQERILGPVQSQITILSSTFQLPADMRRGHSGCKSIQREKSDRARDYLQP